MSSILLYGAYGYTGELIARHAHHYGLQLILAGRKPRPLENMATKLGFSYRVAELDNPSQLEQILAGVKLVIHAAGPFQSTASQMVEACLKTGTHYIDINGDISVFELIRRYDDEARRKGIMLLPGAGFDVVPTDCTALALKNKLPDATSLQIAFATLGGGLSHGTAMSVLQRLGEGGAKRVNGEIVREALGRNGMNIEFFLPGKDQPKTIFVMSIPWGDVSTAYFTTGIGNIETFTSVPKSAYRLLKLQSAFNWLLRKEWVRKWIAKKIDRRPAGPSDEQRKKAMSLIWGRASNEAGASIVIRSAAPDGYTLTMHSCLVIAKKILNGEYAPGYQTPASSYGENLVMEIPSFQWEHAATHN